MTIGILIFSEPRLEQYTGVTRLTEAATQLGHEVIPLYEPFFSVSGKKIWYDRKPLPELDVILCRPNFIEEPGLHRYVTDALHAQGYKLINALPSYGPVKNKIEQLSWFTTHHLPHPTSTITKQPAAALHAAEQLGFPVIVKVAFGTIGSGVFYADSAETFSPIVDYLQIRDGNPVIVQEYIAEAERKDIRVFVVGGNVVAAMERRAPKGDVRANTTSGGTGAQIELTQKERELALLVAQTFGLAIAGVDLIRSARGPLVLEVNANPGFAELERVTGVDVAKAIIEHAAR